MHRGCRQACQSKHSPKKQHTASQQNHTCETIMAFSAITEYELNLEKHKTTFD